jgi:hypothetical protein
MDRTAGDLSANGRHGYSLADESIPLPPAPTGASRALHPCHWTPTGAVSAQQSPDREVGARFVVVCAGGCLLLDRSKRDRRRPGLHGAAWQLEARQGG